MVLRLSSKVFSKPKPHFTHLSSSTNLAKAHSLSTLESVDNKDRKPPDHSDRLTLQVNPSELFEIAGAGLVSSLERVYPGRAERVLDSLKAMGSRYHIRLNSLVANPANTLSEIRSAGIGAELDGSVEDACFLPVKEAVVQPKGSLVVADKFAAEAVLQGAHLYAPGVKRCCGLRAGSEASVVDDQGRVAGSGIARKGETSILTIRQGVAVEVHENRFGLPSLMDTQWYQTGKIHLQSLPAMVTCKVLDPRPGEMIVDLNCAPGGKLSYMCQLTGNTSKIVGFDRNERKLERTRKQLERLGCQNYQLLCHDSRYAHVDYNLEADRVLVDPPCTGLGMTPKLSVETTADNVRSLSSYQRQFLAAASRLVKSGGTVVYSVCSITWEECEEVVDYGVRELGLVLEDAEPMIGRRGLDPGGLTQRFHPDVHGSGFFIARFRKN